MPILAGGLLLSASCCLTLNSASAANETWTTGNNTWDSGTTADWSGSVWTDGNSAIFNGASTVTVSGTVAANSITDTTNGAALTIGGAAGSVLQLGAGGINYSSNTTFTVNNTVSLQLTASQTWSLNPAQFFEISAPVTDTVSTDTLTILHAGGWKVTELAGNNSLSNVTVSNTHGSGSNDYVLLDFGAINTTTNKLGQTADANGASSTIAGTLTIGGAGQTGYAIAVIGNTVSADKIAAGNSTANSNMLEIGGSGTFIAGYNGGSSTFSGNILNAPGAGSATTPVFMKSGTGTLTLTGDNLTGFAGNQRGQLGVTSGFSGTWNLNGGVLNAGSANALGATASKFLFSGGTLQYSAANTVDISSRISNSTAPIAIDTNGQNVTYASGIASSNTGGLTKSGAGTLALTAANNSFTGPITVNAGTLQGNLPTSNTLTINSGAAYASTGSGTIGGLVTVNGTGLLDMRDNTAGQTLTLASGLTLNAGNTLGFDVSSTADSLAITGGSYTFASGAGTATVSISNVVGFAPGTYALITGASGISLGNFAFSNGTTAETVNGFNLNLSTAGSALELVVTSNAPSVAYWNGGQSTVWNTNNSGATNWSTASSGGTDTGATPGGITNVIFSTTSPTPTGEANTTLGADTTINSLTVNDVNAVGIGGTNSLTLLSSGTAINVTAGAGPVTISTNNVVLGADQTWNNDSSNVLTVSGAVGGAQRLTTSGAGTIVLSGSNTYSGGTTIAAGTLQVGNASALGTGDVAVNGTLDLNGTQLAIAALSGSSTGVITNSAGTQASLSTTVASGTSVFAGVIQDGSAAVSLAKSGSGTLVLNNTNTYSGDTTINDGTLQLGDGTTNGSVAGAIVDNSKLAIVNATSQFFLNNISGTGSVTLNTSADATFYGSNSYSGGTTLLSGTLIAGSSNALGTGAVTVTAGTLDVNGQNLAIGSLSGAGAITNSNGTAATLTVNQTSNGTVTGAINDGLGSLALVKSGASQLVLSGSNTYSGGTTINSGELEVRPLTLGQGSGLGSGAVTLNAGLLHFLMDSAGNNSGTISYANSFVLTSGTLYSEDGDVHLATGPGATIDVNGTVTLQRLWGNNGTGKKLNLDGVLQGSGALILNDITNSFNQGGEVLIGNNANTYSGTITVNSASGQGMALVVGGATALQNATVDVEGAGTNNIRYGLRFNPGITTVSVGAIQGNGNIALQDMSASPAPVALSVGGNSASTTFSGVLSGSGSLTKVGAGTLTLTGSSTYTGVTTVSGGSLAIGVGGSINGSSAIDIQSGATLDTTALTSFTVGSAQTLSGAGTVNAQALNVAGTLQPHDSTNPTAQLNINNSGALTLQNGSKIALNLGTGVDLVSATGAINLGSSSTDRIALNISLVQQPVDNMTYTFLTGASLTNTGLFTYNGADLANGSVFDVISGGFGERFQINYTANADFLTAITAVAVPEPNTWAMLVGGLGSLLFVRNLRRRKI